MTKQGKSMVPKGWTRVTAFAPATVANVAVGFDLLGLSLDIVGDSVNVEKIPERTVVLEKITGVETALPTDPNSNSATAGLVRLIADLDLDFGFKVAIHKGIPLGSGMGGSAASAVGAIVAANELLDEPLTHEKMMHYALIGESVASGSFHADNIAPCLYGGLTAASVHFSQTGGQTRSQSGGQTGQVERIEVLELPTPSGLTCILVHPHLRVETREARSLLKLEVPLKDHIRQSAQLAGFLASCYRNDLALMSRSLTDVVIEPQRAHLIPGFREAQSAAMERGALGCSISGSGPSVFALVPRESGADSIRKAMNAAFEKAGLRTDSWIIPLPGRGARVVE